MTDPTPQPDPAEVLTDTEHAPEHNVGCSGTEHLLTATLTAFEVAEVAPTEVFVDYDGFNSIRIRSTEQVVLAVERIVAARTADAAARLAAVEGALAGLEDEVRRLFHVEDDPRGAGRVASAIHAVRAALSATPDSRTEEIR